MINQCLINFVFLFLSYVLGSIPFAYIVTKISSGKNIYDIGWKKSSGSNVTKNIGILEGGLTMFLDIGKAFLAIYLAKYFGLSDTMQVFCGLMTIIGHNWSIFMNFQGGRGLASLIGAVLALSPITLFIVLIPTIFFAIIWTASIGTIISLILGIFISFKGGFIFEPVGYLFILSLIPIFIKRLSPIKELFETKGEKKKELIENRLIFDQDTVPPFRLKFLKNKKPL
ncbi:MAG: glycerol-3-phosphate acyltransferase [Candidatus Pacebacteria bacterium]|nr:glycerol-3-phosphate acyltransferase [Candidatus Paceibacterota bacterium]